MKHIVQRASVAILATLVFWSAADAAEPIKPRVRVEHSGSDSIGKQVTYQLREEIAKSAQMDLADDDGGYLLSVSVVSVDSDNREAGNDASALSLVWAFKPFNSEGEEIYLSSAVRVLGSDMVTRAVGDLVATTHEYFMQAQRMQTALVQKTLGQQKPRD